MIFKLGPFTLYRVEKNGTLDISITALDNWPCGWEYGYRDDMRGTDKPMIEFRIGKLMIAYVEFYKSGCEVWFFGFWAFLNVGKQWWEK